MEKLYKHTIVCVGGWTVSFTDNRINTFDMNAAAIIINEGGGWGVGSKMVNVANVIEIFVEEVKEEVEDE